ncbi:MAG: hypothetical protein KDB61_05075 [Planctomycetes bacterium]|nr:hypothetical protein [Planctomycetota bacterium]
MPTTLTHLLLALCLVLPHRTPLSRAEEVEEFYDSGEIHLRYEVNEEGQKHGTYFEFAEDGTLLVQARYAADALDGRELRFFPSGKRHIVANWQKGLLHGRFDRYYENGRSDLSTGYKKGVESGKYTKSSEDGKWVMKASHKDGLLDGALKVTDHGKTLSDQKWKAGIPVEIDGIEPFPRKRDELLQELLATWKAPEDASETTPMDLERAAALRRLQTYRALCRLRYDDLELVPEWNDLCEAASIVCRALGRITHTPEDPGTVEPEIYQKGVIGAKNSNLSMGVGLARSVDSYMDDSDQSNIARVGHRRWCLNPTLKRTGFGKADAFSAMWSMDSSGKGARKLDAVLYPPPGYVPVEMFARSAAWSIVPLSGSLPKESKIHITLQPLGEFYLPEGQPLKVDTLHVAGSGVGAGPALIFRSDNLEVAPGKRYRCQVQYDGDRAPTYDYLVEFVTEPELICR